MRIALYTLTAIAEIIIAFLLMLVMDTEMPVVMLMLVTPLSLLAETYLR